MMNPYQQVNDSQVERLAGSINGYVSFLGDIVYMGIKVAADIALYFALFGFIGVGIMTGSPMGLIGGPLAILAVLMFQAHLFELDRKGWIFVTCITGFIAALCIAGWIGSAFQSAPKPAVLTADPTSKCLRATGGIGGHYLFTVVEAPFKGTQYCTTDISGGALDGVIDVDPSWK